MIESVIAPEDYTPEILNVIEQLKYKMHQCSIDYKDDDIKVVEHEGTFYILANPVLGEEPIYDDSGNVEEYVPMYNLTLIYPRDWIKFKWLSDRLVVKAKAPKLRIFIPELCARISK